MKTTTTVRGMTVAVVLVCAHCGEDIDGHTDADLRGCNDLSAGTVARGDYTMTLDAEGNCPACGEPEGSHNDEEFCTCVEDADAAA